jgi:eukaryotic-like serine/threonine-protein kinase
MPPASPARTPPPAANPPPVRPRLFGRLQLLRLLGKSERSMAWRVADRRRGQELVLVLPRVQPADAAALQAWRDTMRQAARIDHPQLAVAIETGVQEGWPFALYEAGDAVTLAEQIGRQGLPGAEAAQLLTRLLAGLAFAHEAGAVHRDLQPHLVLVKEGGAPKLLGLGVVPLDAGAAEAAEDPLDPQRRQALRSAAGRDVLAAGLLLHRLIVGSEGEVGADLAAWIERLPPIGRESLRLPWTLPQPLPEPLRAIANRATDRQERQRYRSARALLRALEGWLQTEAGSGGPLALLEERVRTAGLLPSAPGAAARAARLALMERERTAELAEVVLEDLALSFEMLRTVNLAQTRLATAGSGPVLAVRRAIALLGLEGVRRAALTLRAWPGPLSDGGAAALEREIARCKQAARIAIALRPPGYDGEVVYLITLLQRLGTLIVQYHFPDESEQVRRLMQPGPPARDGDTEEPGMTAAAAAYAVMGADLESIGQAVARQWGLPDEALAMIRRLPQATPVRAADGDDALLRAVASCAHEAVDALELPAPRVQAALAQVASRYARVLGLSARDLVDAARSRPIERISEETRPAALDEAVADGAPPARRSSLRAKAVSG